MIGSPESRGEADTMEIISNLHQILLRSCLKNFKQLLMTVRQDREYDERKGERNGSAVLSGMR